MHLIDDITYRRQRLLDGYRNVLPFGLPMLENHIPGIEKGYYYLITANAKVGKTQITDYLFLLNQLNFKWTSTLVDNKVIPSIDNAYYIKDDIEIHYISLELSALEKEYAILSHFLSLLLKKPVTIQDLKSATRPIEETYLSLIDKNLKDFLRFVQSKVKIVDNLATAVEIANYIRTVAKSNSLSNETYVPKYPDKYYVFIIDHIGLMLSDKTNNTIGASIDYLSRFMVSAKKMFNHTYAVIQQQYAQSESIQSLQYRSGEPTLEGLADNKSTARDANIVFGLYSPFRNNILTHRGLDTSKFGDKYRSLHILADRNYGTTGNFTRLYFDGSWNYFSKLN